MPLCGWLMGVTMAYGMRRAFSDSLQAVDERIGYDLTDQQRGCL